MYIINTHLDLIVRGKQVKQSMICSALSELLSCGRAFLYKQNETAVENNFTVALAQECPCFCHLIRGTQ